MSDALFLLITLAKMLLPFVACAALVRQREAPALRELLPARALAVALLPLTQIALWTGRLPDGFAAMALWVLQLGISLMCITFLLSGRETAGVHAALLAAAMLTQGIGPIQVEHLCVGALVALAAMAAAGWRRTARWPWILAACGLLPLVAFDLYRAVTFPSWRIVQRVFRSADVPSFLPSEHVLIWEIGTRATIAVLALFVGIGDRERQALRARRWFWIWLAVELPDLLPLSGSRAYPGWCGWALVFALTALRRQEGPLLPRLRLRPLDPVTVLVAIGVAGAGSWWLWPHQGGIAALIGATMIGLANVGIRVDFES